ncbi:UDP-2,3-diacylglucosamine pyrophosphatase [Azospirillum thiophilum]|uniref:UDP-2,3-diacylglucosamine pyrophosphatase n=1 Tax=Azospirillum thiophilum TaxID=528244 RepID=A0AAC8VY88_9PROT|nr:UDP-2,3-diacylglucosamine diphosphatase LpxI [Azospirillum thiophilum]ALG71628.1 UDP-2,3-diacylglucosamine pyrophosphatase [Azospirillum thiophilum]KJR64722.1 UDP-2,3-diacylglucosamine pyrophosphatase [Azospirillum thiophilum]
MADSGQMDSCDSLGPKLAILAGGGTLPARIASAVRGQGREVFVVAFDGHTDPETVAGLPHLWSRFGAAGTILRRLHDEGVGEVVLAGPVKRPSFTELMPDWRTARFLARVGTRALGDDGLLRAVIREMEEDGFRVIGLQELLKDLLTTLGPVGRRIPDAEAERDIARAVEVARALGALDVGQGAVVQQGIVLAVEAIEGTDEMLARCAGLARPGPGGVLVKVKKPRQDRRIDLPTMGVTTVEKAASAGLRGIAVEAGGSLLVDRTAVAEAADRLGLFVVGIEAPQ